MSDTTRYELRVCGAYCILGHGKEFFRCHGWMENIRLEWVSDVGGGAIRLDDANGRSSHEVWNILGMFRRPKWKAKRFCIIYVGLP